jgi:hypothetical protein
MYIYVYVHKYIIMDLSCCDCGKKIIDTDRALHRQGKHCYECTLKLIRKGTILESVLYKCGLCNKNGIYRDIVYYENGCCVHHEYPICSEDTKSLCHLDAYRLELHCTKCIAQCDICGYYGCNCHNVGYVSEKTCETSECLVTIFKCNQCQKNVCNGCVEKLTDEDIILCPQCLQNLAQCKRCDHLTEEQIIRYEYPCTDHYTYECKYCRKLLVKYCVTPEGGCEITCEECCKDPEYGPCYIAKIRSTDKLPQKLPDYLYIY